MTVASRACVCCERVLPIQEYRGARFKARACKSCEVAHPGERWCVDCADWLPEDDFYKIGPDKRFQTIRCKPCVVLFSHGVTRTHMAELTGSPTPSCGACGSASRLSIDHDHAHCAGERGCKACVRGYLCRSCNTAEGLLRTPERAKALADYMEATRLTEDQLARLDPSPRKGVQRVKKYKGPPREFYEPRSA